MNKSTESINSLYGNRVRLRVCGIHIHNNKILLVKHTGIGTTGIFWAPPGGGINLGESLLTGLKREVKEETNLDAHGEELLFVHEFIQAPLHAIEIFFKIETHNVNFAVGMDPEHSEQIIEDVKYFSEKEIYQSNLEEFHQIFTLSRSFNELLTIKGYLRG